MNAIKLLEDDHRAIKRLLSDGEATTERAVKTRTELFARIAKELETHERIEEEIFYPALKQHPKARADVLEGFEEHHVVDEIVGEMGEVDVGDERWTAKFTVMKEQVEHHIADEEEKLLPKARQIFDAAQLEALGARMAELRTLAAG